MDTNLVALNEKNIRTAIVDYRRHTSEVTVLDDISEDFIQRLAVDSFNSKAELRNLFSTSPAWNEDLQAIVINGTRTHNPDSDKIEDLAFKILKPFEKDAELCHNIIQAIHFFSKTDDNLADYISAINFIAPKAYSPNKKKSRIFKAICDALIILQVAIFKNFSHSLLTKFPLKRLILNCLSALTPLIFSLCLILNSMSAALLWLAVIRSILPSILTTAAVAVMLAITTLSLFSLRPIQIILKL